MRLLELMLLFSMRSKSQEIAESVFAPQKGYFHNKTSTKSWPPECSLYAALKYDDF